MYKHRIIADDCSRLSIGDEFFYISGSYHRSIKSTIGKTSLILIKARNKNDTALYLKQIKDN